MGPTFIRLGAMRASHQQLNPAVATPVIITRTSVTLPLLLLMVPVPVPCAVCHHGVLISCSD